MKEVGICKVMGATVCQLVRKLSWNFLLLLAQGLAYPLGYLASTAPLRHFAYRVSMGLETVGLWSAAGAGG